MKNFLKKMPVFITALSVAVVLLIVYIAMLARPVAYGMAYTTKMDLPISEGVTTSSKVTFKIKNDREGVMTMDTEVMGIKTNISVTMWLVRDGRKIAFVAPKEANDMFGDYVMTEEQYNALIENKEALDQYFNSDECVKVNAFTIKMNGAEALEMPIDTINAKCVGTIVFASVMGVVELAVIAFAAVSTTFFILGRKKKEA